MADQVVGRHQRQRDQPQDNCDSPKNYRLAPQTDLRRKMRDSGKERDSAGERCPDEPNRHLLERPVIKKIQRRKEYNLNDNENGKADKQSALHVRAAGSAACIASNACTGIAGGTTTPLRVIR